MSTFEQTEDGAPERKKPATREGVAGCIIQDGKKTQALMKARISGLSTSAWVVSMPCGKPG